MSLSLASPATEEEEIIFKPQELKRRRALRGDRGYSARATEQEVTGLMTRQGDHSCGGRDTAFPWLPCFVVTHTPPLRVPGKNSTTPCEYAFSLVREMERYLLRTYCVLAPK